MGPMRVARRPEIGSGKRNRGKDAEPQGNGFRVASADIEYHLLRESRCPIGIDYFTGEGVRRDDFNVGLFLEVVFFAPNAVHFLRRATRDQCALLRHRPNLLRSQPDYRDELRGDFSLIWTNCQPKRPLMQRWPEVTEWSIGEVTRTILPSCAWTVSVQPTPQ